MQCAPMGCAAANMGGAAPQLIIAPLVARANVPRPQPQPQTQVVAVVVMSAASLAQLFLTRCLSIEMTRDAKVMGSTSMMLSLLLLGLLMGLAQLGMLM